MTMKIIIIGRSMPAYAIPTPKILTSVLAILSA